MITETAAHSASERGLVAAVFSKPDLLRPQLTPSRAGQAPRRNANVTHRAGAIGATAPMSAWSRICLEFSK
jgi:hypothetical protein